MTKSADDKTNDGMCLCGYVCVIAINHYRLIVIRISLSSRHPDLFGCQLVLRAIVSFGITLRRHDCFIFGDGSKWTIGLRASKHRVCTRSFAILDYQRNLPGLRNDTCLYVCVIKRALSLSLKLQRVVFSTLVL